MQLRLRAVSNPAAAGWSWPGPAVAFHDLQRLIKPISYSYCWRAVFTTSKSSGSMLSIDTTHEETDLHGKDQVVPTQTAGKLPGQSISVVFT
eukprot:scaffold227098_cov18-Prasinocladus_malaysianus.AAC.1